MIASPPRTLPARSPSRTAGIALAASALLSLGVTLACSPESGAGSGSPGSGDGLAAGVPTLRDLAETPQSDFLLLATSGVQGFIEPCGCVAGQIGGIDRLVGYVEDELAAHGAGVFVDLGDLVARHYDPDPALADQLPLKADAFYRVWAEAGCAALAVGETDLSLGVETLVSLAAKHGLPLINANIVDAEGRPAFSESVVVEVAGKRVGFFSVLGPALVEDEVGGKERPVDVQALVEGLGYQLLPWQAPAQRVAADLASRCDLVVAAAHLGFAGNKELARLVPSIDVVIGPHWENASKETHQLEDTLVLVPFAKGGRMARLEYWWRDEADFFGPDASRDLEDVTPYETLRTNHLIESISLADVITRAAEMDDERYARKQGTHSTMAERYADSHDALPPFPSAGNLFAFDLVPMHFALRRSETALTAIDDYHEATHAFWEERTPAELHESKLFIGPESCDRCHPAQVEFWRATQHSFAISALAATMQDADAECIGCHSVGYQKPGGFRHPGQRESYVNVQCAACHGPGGRHAVGGADALDQDLIVGSGLLDCERCHNKEHDPSFQDTKVEKLAAVACPPMTGPGGGTAALLEAYLFGGRYLEGVDPEYRPWYKVTNAYRMAGARAEEVRSAREWVAALPNSRRAALSLAEALAPREGEVPGEASLEALEIFRAVLDEDGDNARAWIGYGELMLGRNDEEALLAGKEALSLANHRPDAVRLVARALIALGRPEEARAALATHLEFHPTHANQLGDLLER